MKIELTPEWITVGKALNSEGAQFTITKAPNGDVIAWVFVGGAPVASVPAKDVGMLLRNLAALAEQTK